MFSTTANIAICFNNEVEARALAFKIADISPHMKFIISSNFDGFLKAISKTERVDCFIIEEKYKECKAIDLIEKLKGSQRYKKSLLSVYTPDLKKMDKTFNQLNLDYIFDSSTTVESVHQNLEKIILKKITPLIPENYNVMVLDNNQDMLEIISMHLKELGHSNFDLCYSVKSAEKNLSEKAYDLLLLDWNLDDGTCIDLMNFIKENPVNERTKNALTVVITGRDDVDDIMTLLRFGVKDTIIKPFEFNEFEDKLGYALEKHLKK